MRPGRATVVYSAAWLASGCPWRVMIGDTLVAQGDDRTAMERLADRINDLEPTTVLRAG